MKIEILGMGCSKCKKTLQNVRDAMIEKGIKADVFEVKDINIIAEYGVMMTPSVVVDGEVKCVGKIPTIDEIKKWIGGE